jgi:hypothetical protein
MMSRCYGYLLLQDRARQVGGSLEHSEGKGWESDVVILRFLCSSPRLCRLRTASFWPRWQALSCVLTTCQVFMGSGKPSSTITTSSNRTPCLKYDVGGGNEAEGQDFTRGQGTNFNGVGTLQMAVIRESLRESSV